jgi:hypothetical protein
VKKHTVLLHIIVASALCHIITHAGKVEGEKSNYDTPKIPI